MTLGEYLIRLLEAQGVSHVFGIPGVHTLELYRGLATSRIRHVLPRHEQGAGFMADGYARVTGKPGVCFTITGPGLVNVLTAMGQAYADSIPMLVVSGVNRRSDLGHGHGLLHELSDQQAMVRPVCAFTHQVQCAEELPGVLARAFAVFESERPRPVHIEVPIDVMSLPVDDVAAGAVRPARARRPADHADHATANAIRAAVEKAERALLILGGGCAWTDPDITAAAVDALGLPAVQTINGRNCLPHDHPLAVPASPSLEAVRAEMDAADLIVVLGSEIGRTDFDMFATGMHSPRKARLVRVDIDARQLATSQFPGRSNADDLLIRADCGPVLAALVAQAPAPGPALARAKALCAAARAELGPAMQAGLAFLEGLREAIPDAIVVGDSTQPVYAGNLFYGTARGGRWFNSSVGFGTLGYALPAALGAKLGRPDQPVIALTGDGGLQFTLGELGGICAERPIVVLVWNNRGYGEIRSSMEAVGIEPVGVDFPPPDLGMIAAAYGLAFQSHGPGAGLVAAVTAAIAANQPSLIEIRAD